MNKSYGIFVAVALLALAATAPVVASKELLPVPDKAANDGNNCSMQETANVNISFQGADTDVKTVQKLLDEQVTRIENLAKECGIEGITLQSQSYNVYAQPQNGYGSARTAPQFQFSGNATFVFSPAGEAPALIARLAEEGVQFNVSVNSYRNNNACQ